MLLTPFYNPEKSYEENYKKGSLDSNLEFVAPGIKWACLDMVGRLSELNSSASSKLTMVSVGGVMNADDYHEVRRVGADVVMSERAKCGILTWLKK